MTSVAPDIQITTRNRRAHHRAQGFCTTCGTTWPCWGAQVDDAKAAVLRTAPHFGLPRC